VISQEVEHDCVGQVGYLHGTEEQAKRWVPIHQSIGSFTLNHTVVLDEGDLRQKELPPHRTGLENSLADFCDFLV